MTLTQNGIEIALTFDEDGFPLVSIDTGGGYYAENMRPSIEVKLNDVMIHDMFGEDDERWNDSTKFVAVEYDLTYFGGEYSKAGEIALIPHSLVDSKGGVEAAFAEHTGHDPQHSVHYCLDEPVDENGDIIDG